MVGSVISHYNIVSELGRGGMGIVYKAEDTKLDRTVAIKVLPSAALVSEYDSARIHREVIRVDSGQEAPREESFVHREVTSGKEILVSKSEAKNIDFGLAQIGWLTKLKRKGSGLGSVTCTCPAQASGEEVDLRPNHWSLGNCISTTLLPI